MKTKDLSAGTAYVSTRGYMNGVVFVVRAQTWSHRPRPRFGEKYEPGKRDFSTNGVLTVFVRTYATDRPVQEIEFSDLLTKAKKFAEELSSLSDEAISKKVSNRESYDGFAVSVIPSVNITHTLDGYNEEARENSAHQQESSKRRGLIRTERDSSVETVKEIASEHGFEVSFRSTYSDDGRVELSLSGLKNLVELLKKLG